MGWQMIPNQDDPAAGHEPLELFEKADQTPGVEAVWLRSGEQSGAVAVPAESQRGRNRSLAPVIAA
jgi:hypothetical protein